MKEREKNIRSSASEYLTYIAATGNSDIFEIRYEDENIWLTQKVMASLYGVDLGLLMNILKIFIVIKNYWKLQLSGNSG